MAARTLCQLLLRAAGYRRGVGAPCSRGTMTGRRGYRQGRGGAEEHSGVLCQPLRSQCGGLRVRLQRTALVPGQKICQPVQNCGQRQAGGSVLIPVTPTCTAAKVAFHRDLCTGAGILRDDTNIVRAGALPQFLHKALGAGGIQPILPAVGAEVGLAEQAVGTGRKNARSAAHRHCGTAASPCGTAENSGSAAPWWSSTQGRSAPRAAVLLQDRHRCRRCPANGW